jgi:2-(1,2-epoxy-1,2-dihydrophenyl)acetyl-CoA isomerase
LVEAHHTALPSRGARAWVDGAVGTVAIERRERFNSLDIDGAHALEQAARAIVRDPAVRVVVLQGTAGMFCSGADLKFIAAEARASGRGYGSYFREIVGSFHRTILELRRAPVPVIVAVDGSAAAGGMGIALGCGDLVVASSRSTFEYAYFKTGLTGAESATFFLPRLLGPGRAASLALLSPRLTAAEAQELGLVAEVYDEPKLAAGVRELAARLATGPTDAYAAAKCLMNESLGIDRLEAHLARELDHLCRAADGPDFAEASPRSSRSAPRGSRAGPRRPRGHRSPAADPAAAPPPFAARQRLPDRALG